MIVFSAQVSAAALPPVSVTAGYFAADSTPVQKEAGLLKRLLEKLRFRKNALAREQKRVLAIIDSTGLRKAVDSLQRQMVLQGAAQDTLIDSLITTLAKRLDALQAKVDTGKSSAKDSVSHGHAVSPGDTVDIPGGTSSFESLISQIMPLLQNGDAGAAQQMTMAHVKQVRDLLARSPLAEDTLRINDTLSKRCKISLVHRASVTGFYPFWSHPDLPAQTFAIVNNMDYDGLVFQGATGDVAPNGWDTAAVVQEAQAAGASVFLTLHADKPGEVDALLRKGAAQDRLILHIRRLLSYRNADGVTVYFEQLPPGAVASDRFTTFMDALSDSLHSEPFHFKVNLVLPRVYDARQYNLTALALDVDQFMIDFTHADAGGRRHGPLAPLKGVVNSDLQSCISSYLTSGLPPARFIVVLPYYGVLDTVGAPRYKTYAGIHTRYKGQPAYDAATQTAYADSPGLARIWFDDARTLSLKYDYVLQLGLGGVAIRSMGDDVPYGELQEVLMDKFMDADTVYLGDIRRGPRPLIPFTGWKFTWPYLSAKYEQYEFLFSYPCLTDFPKVLRKRWSRMGITDLERNSVEDEATATFACFTIFLFLLLAGAVFFFAFQIRRMPRWQWRRYWMVLMVLLAVALTVSAFMFAFVTKSIGGFGTSSSPQEC